MCTYRFEFCSNFPVRSIVLCADDYDTVVSMLKSYFGESIMDSVEFYSIFKSHV